VDPLALRFVMSAASLDQLPRTDREVAVIGRSNVGKSSLLNALAGRKALAKVSGKPGRTQLLNLFALDGTGATLVDLPGYGYASTASKTDRAAWDRRMRGYLRQREGLVLTLALIDGEVGPTALDMEMLSWLRDNDVPFRIVATKHDKVKSSQRQRRKRDLAAKAEVEPGDVLWVSVTKNVGVDALRGFVREVLASRS
jgi:GTP-binding protein